MPVFRRPSLVPFMSHTFPKILLAAMVGIISISGCLQAPTPLADAMAPRPDQLEPSPLPTQRQTPTPQLPDNALFPLVNIYGELRPAVYRAGQTHANFSFQQHTATDEGHDADVVLDP